MNQTKRLLSDFEKLTILNRICKVQHVSNPYRTNYHHYSKSPLRNNPQTLYLQKTNPFFMPQKVKLIKKQREINSLSPNSFRNSNLDINNRSFDFQNKNLNKINELKNSLGNPKYARNMMVNNDLRNYKYISISSIPNSGRDEIYRMNNSYDNKNRRRYLFKSNKKKIRSKSYNNLPVNQFNYLKNKRYNTLYTNSNQSDINNQYQLNLNNLNQQEIQVNNSDNNEIIDINLDLDNLTYIEGRLNDIISVLYSEKNIFDMNAKNECFQFLKYYKQSTVFNKFSLFFTSDKNQLIIKSAFNLHLFIVIITYDLSSNQIILNKVINLLKRIYFLLKTNYFLIISQIELSSPELNNDIHFNTSHYFLQQKGFNYFNENDKINIINNNCISIVNDLKIILNLFQIMNNKHFFDLRNLYLNISRINEQDIYNYFYTSLSLDDGSININNNYQDNNPLLIKKEQEDDEQFLDKIIFAYKLNKVIPPFLDYKSKKKYTVVLDLEDTLLNIKLTDNGKLIINLRPGLISFLTGIKPYYEIISFSKFSKSYSNTIINYIQQGRKLFDVNLYREHCALMGKKFIKDISRIGRDMKRIIMVDDLPENLERFKANGILILPYEGEEQSNDRVLYELKKIMILFYKMGYDDIRSAIKQYKNDIKEKITFGINE